MFFEKAYGDNDKIRSYAETKLGTQILLAEVEVCYCGDIYTTFITRLNF